MKEGKDRIEGSDGGKERTERSERGKERTEGREGEGGRK